MLIRNRGLSLFVLLILVQMTPHHLHAGKFRKAIITLSTESTRNTSWQPNQIFDFRTQGLSLVEDSRDFIEIMRTPFLFNDASYAYHDKFQNLYEKFFSDNVIDKFINNKATIADMYELEDVLIFWPSALKLRSKFLEINPPRDLKTVLSIIQGTSESIKEASSLTNIFSVVIQRNTALIASLLLDSTHEEWIQFSVFFENAPSSKRLIFYRGMLQRIS